MVLQEREIKFKNYFGYGLVDVIGSGGFTLTTAWLLYFYTTFCGLTPMQGASIFALARIVDVVMSPTMGFITDNFYKTRLGRRFGRRRFFLLLAVPMIGIYSLMWVSGFQYFYYVLTYIGFEIVYSMVMIPYDTLSAEMTSDFKKRAKLTSARMYIAQISAFLAAFLPGRIINYLGTESSNSFLYAGMIFTGAFIIALLVVYFSTWERSYKEVEAAKPGKEEESLSFGEILKKIYIDFITTLKIKSFRAHLGMYLGGSVAQDVFNAVFTYFIIFVLAQTSVVASNLLGVMNGFQIAGVALATYLTLRFSMSRAFSIQSFLAVGVFIGYFLAYKFLPGDFVILYIIAAVSGIARGGIYCIPWNSYTFIADVDEIISCQRREGIFAGFMSFLRKTSQAVSIFLVGVILQEFNFVSGSHMQNSDAISAIVFILIVIPLVLTGIGIYSAYKFKITKETHSVLKEEVLRLKNGGNKKDVDAHTKEVVEDLTGLAYENLWGNNNVGYENWKKYHKNLSSSTSEE